MKRMRDAGPWVLFGSAALAFAAIQGAGAPARAAEQPYASARACLKAVNAAEERLMTEERASSKLKDILGRAQDYCIQTRYERAADLLSEAKQQAAAAAD